jgi:molybdopterin-guanine dinucleotide biosynthesis protein A
MGYPKAWLPFGPELMLPRIVRLLGEVVEPVLVVAAPEQDLPPLPADVLIVRDRREGRGPLEGLSAGLAALAGAAGSDLAEAAYATSCDVPLLSPAFVQRLVSLCEGRKAENDDMENYDLVVPYVGGYYHPLAAVYRVGVLAEIDRLLLKDRLRPAFLFEQVRTRVVGEAELRDADPGLQSLRNLNHPADYFTALKLAGYEAPLEIRAMLSAGDSEKSNG